MDGIPINMKYRVNLPDGNHRIYYDDGYKRVCDSHGYVLSWGY